MPIFNEDLTVNGITRLRGTLGIGTDSPRTTVHVIGRISSGLDFTSAGAMTFFPPDGFAWFHIDNGPSGGRPIGRLRISHGNNPGDNEIMNILQNGNIGIGTNAPAARLHVNGSIRTTGDIVLENADCAEEFDVPDHEVIKPGMVMSLNDDASVSPSSVAYDRRVAGVISGAGSFRPALVLDKRDGVLKRVPLALLGKVFCMADASESPIAVGDLLTTSQTAGHAMKATDPGRAFGAVLGKALGSLKEGQGLLPVLVALQ